MALSGKKMKPTGNGHRSWCLLWHLRTGGTIADSVKGDCKPLRFSQGFMTTLKALFMALYRTTLLTKAPGDIILGFLLFGMRKEPARLSLFDQPSLQKEDRFLCHTPRLLHIMRHDHDRVALSEFPNQFFYLKGRNGIERRSSLVHKQNLIVNGQRTGDPQSLMLPT